LCAEFYCRCHSDLEQKRIGYNPDLEESFTWTIFEKTSSENGSESTRGCSSKMGEERENEVSYYFVAFFLFVINGLCWYLYQAYI